MSIHETLPESFCGGLPTSTVAPAEQCSPLLSESKNTTHEPVPVWPSSSQAVTAGVLVLLFGLIGWQAYTGSRLATRPTVQEIIQKSTDRSNDGDLRNSRENGSLFRLDLNRTDKADLMQLSGIGPALADRILAERDRLGGFQSMEELAQVRGIGPVLLARLQSQVQISSVEADPLDGPRNQQTQKSPQTLKKTQKSAQSVQTVTSGTKPKSMSGQIDINHASEADLQQLPGIGKTLAARIVEVRSTQPFTSVEDLRRVKGIGPKTLEKVRPHVVTPSK